MSNGTKQIYVTQTYEMIVTIQVQVPKDYTLDEMESSLEAFPIMATVESAVGHWDDLCLDENLTVGSVSLDSLIPLEGIGTMIITDENGDPISGSAPLDEEA